MQTQEAQISSYTEQCQIHFSHLHILRDFQGQRPVLISVQACDLFHLSRSLYNYQAFWILRNQWVEKSYTFSQKQLSNHSTISKLPFFSLQNPTQLVIVMKLSFPILLLQLDNFFPDSMFAFHMVSLKFPFLPVCFPNTETLATFSFLSNSIYIHTEFLCPS